MKYQYNKISLQNLNKQLNIRLRAVPTLKNKEAALRIEVKKAKENAQELENKFINKLSAHTQTPGIWNEFNLNLITIDTLEIQTKKITGVKIPVLENIVFKTDEFSLFNNPTWFPEGILIVKELAKIKIEKAFFVRKMELLNHARRKTTQKVNLYEKVQIPEYENAIRKIKRFLEDEENLSKSAQKIVKKRHQMELEAER